MNGIKYLLDTNIIIGMYEHNQAVIQLFQSNNATLSECAYSAITRMELLGFPNITENEIQFISDLLKQMTHIGIDQAVEETTIQLKQQYRMKLPDAMIFATAKTNDLELLTLDKRIANKL